MRVHLRTSGNAGHIQQKARPQSRATLTHAEQAKASGPIQGVQLLLQLQQHYGNRYVQRILAQAGKTKGEAKTAPSVEVIQHGRVNLQTENRGNKNRPSLVQQSRLFTPVPQIQTYRKDVHNDMTEGEATGVGFSDGDAHIIAEADKAVDEGWTHPHFRTPFEMVFPPMRGENMLHFPKRSITIKELDVAIKDCNLKKFGRALHRYQDSYSHSFPSGVVSQEEKERSICWKRKIGRRILNAHPLFGRKAVLKHVCLGTYPDNYMKNGEQATRDNDMTIGTMKYLDRLHRECASHPSLGEGEGRSAPKRGKGREAGEKSSKIPAEVNTSDVEQEIDSRLTALYKHVNTAIHSFENWFNKTKVKVDDLDPFAKFLRDKLKDVFGVFLKGPYAAGAAFVYEIMMVAVDQAVADQIRSIEDFRKNMTARFLEITTTETTKKQKEVKEKLTKAVATINQTKVNVENHDEVVDAVTTHYFKIPDYKGKMLWPQLLTNLVEQYLTFYWTRVASRTRRGIMSSLYPGMTFQEIMQHMAKESTKYYRIAPMSKRDPKYKKVVSLIKVSDFEALLQYAGGIGKEDRYAIGKNEEIKELIRKSDMDYILRGMSRALFFIE